jgi:cobalt-zinc-cadmium efflux system protein
VAHHHHNPAQRPLKSAFLLIASFTLVEAAGGWLTNSLTLLADAGHMFLDASSLGLAWYALHLAQRAHDAQLSYGYHRFQVLAAFVNGLSLLALCGWIVVEAIGRLSDPQPVLAGPALAVAGLGLIINLVAYRILEQSATTNLNVRAAVWHVIGDVLGSVAAIAATSIILLTGWYYADPLLAFVVVAILLRGAVKVIIEAGHILLEGVPQHLDLEQIKARLTESIAEVVEIHHVHAWALTSERPMVTLHATIKDGSDAHAAVARIKAVLNADFGVGHSTIQIEHGPCPDDEHHH